MPPKSTYKELEQRVKELEKEAVERTQVEEALRKSEKKYRDLFETSMVGIYRTRLEDGKILDANNSLAKMMGYESVDTFIEEHVTSEHYADPKRREELLKKLQSDGKVAGFEIEMVRIDGSHIHIALSAVVYPDRGYLEGAIIDITQRKQAEKALEESENRYKALFESANDAIFIMKDKTFIDCNRKTLEMFGCTREQILGQPPYRFSPANQPDGSNSTEKALKLISAAMDGKSRVFEWQHTKLDGTPFDVQVSLNQVVLKSGLHLLAVVRDITAHKNAEERHKSLQAQLYQFQKMEAIGTLAGGIAHDFNNVLTPIIGYAELIGMSDLPAGSPIRSNLEEILKAANRARDLIHQILTFSRQTEQERIYTRLQPIIKETLKLLRPSIPSTIQIRQNVQQNTGSVIADPTQMYQVLMNLYTNAAYAMRNQGEILEVNLEEIYLDEISAAQVLALEPGSYIKITVRDTGHGMDRETIDRIFDPFFTTKKNEGTGLGLSVVHGIIKDHGGEISVESEIGKGSIFNIFLPSAKKEAVEDSTAAVDPTLGKNECILFVDDEKAIIDLLRMALESLGYNVVAKTNVLEALESFRRQPDRFDIVVTDQTMPHMRGVDLAKELLLIRSDIPIILCTGYSESINPKDVQTMGIYKLLFKPLSTRELAKNIREILDRND